MANSNKERSSFDISAIRPTHTRLSEYQNKMGEHLDRLNMQLDEEIADLRRILRQNKTAIKSGTKKRETLKKEIKKLEFDVRISGENQEKFKSEVQKAHDERTILTTKLREHRQKGVDLEEKKHEARFRLEAAQAKVAEMRKDFESQTPSRYRRNSLESTKEIDNLKKRKDSQHSKLEKLRKEIAEVEKELENLENLENQPPISKSHSAKEPEKTNRLETEKEERRSPKRIDQEKHHPPGTSKSTIIAANVDSVKTDELKTLIADRVTYLEELNASLAESRDRLRQERQEIENLGGRVQGLTTANAELKQKYSALKKRKGKTASRSSSVNKSRSNSEASLGIDGPRLRTSKMRSELVNLQRQQSALENRKAKLTRELETREKEIEPLRENSHQLNNHLIALQREQKLLEEIPLPVEEIAENSNHSMLPKSENEKKRDEINENLHKMRAEIEQNRAILETKKNQVHDLQKKLEPFANLDIAKFEAERNEKQVELRHLKNYHKSLQKALHEKQRELELTVIQRDDSVDRANATLNSYTTVRNHRLQEIEDLRQSIVEKEKEIAELKSKGHQDRKRVNVDE